MTVRKLKESRYSIGPTQTVSDLREELEKQIAEDKYRFLLAYLDDGVIWGYIKNKTLQLSSDAFPDVSPALRAEKLWELRLFGNKAEWYVWRADGDLFSRTVVDGQGEEEEKSFDEDYLLWGTIIDGAPQNVFQLVRESDLGIVHTPPVVMKAGERHNVKLRVRHYVAHDECGAAYVKLSRLVDLYNGGEA